jgi:RNA polymerase sigma-70 factor (ECF subfamily)
MMIEELLRTELQVTDAMETHASLLERLRQPAQEQAWARFVELYTPLLFHWARHLGLQEPDAADLVQDVLTSLLQKLPEFTYDRDKSFRSWLRTVTFNRWRDNCKQRARQPLAGHADTLAAVPGPDQADAFWDEEYCRHLVGRALAVMRAEFQESTWRACWEFVTAGKPAAQVARELGITENAVYLAKGRVLRRLRDELQGLMD